MLHVCSTAPALFRMLRLSRRRLACADANACLALLIALLLATIRASILDAVEPTGVGGLAGVLL